MAHEQILDLALECLRGPLNPSPLTAQDNFINDIRMKYRTYFVEYNMSDGALMLPRLFVDDFGDDIGRIAILTDPHGNNFEVLVDKVGYNVYFTKGWPALKDFYDITVGAWIVLVYMGMGRFNIALQNRFRDVIVPPVFVPPARFIINKCGVPPIFVENLPDSADLLSYCHEDSYFNLLHQKLLTNSDVTAGFLTLPYEDFGEYAFHETTTAIKLVDDSGNAWNCTLAFVSTPFKHFQVGGEWSVVVAVRRLIVGNNVRVGVEGIGTGEVLYFELDR